MEGMDQLRRVSPADFSIDEERFRCYSLKKVDVDVSFPKPSGRSTSFMPGGIALPAVNTAARGSLNRPRLRPVRPAAAASVGGSPSPPRRPVRNQSRGRHHRTSIASLMADEDTNVDDLNVDDLLPTNDSAQWQTTVKRVSRAVVVIKTTGVRSFDTESAGSAYATGFVVDAARGLILTNRHVLRPGPVVAEAVFQNREEVPLRALYCDPVHDFAFFRFDPALLRFHRWAQLFVFSNFFLN